MIALAGLMANISNSFESEKEARRYISSYLVTGLRQHIATNSSAGPVSESASTIATAEPCTSPSCFLCWWSIDAINATKSRPRVANHYLRPAPSRQTAGDEPTFAPVCQAVRPIASTNAPGGPPCRPVSHRLTYSAGLELAGPNSFQPTRSAARASLRCRNGPSRAAPTED